MRYPSLRTALPLLICLLWAFAASPGWAAEPAPASGAKSADAPRTIHQRAAAALEAGELETVDSLLATLDEAAEAAPQTLLLRGRLALVRDDVERAEDLLDRAVELRGSSDDHLYYGRALLARLQAAGLFEKASLAPRVRGAFRQAVEDDPRSAQARVSLANFYLHAPSLGGGSKTEARRHAEALIEIDPSMGHPLLAQVLAASGDPEGALKQRELAVAAEPESLPRLYQLGLAYQTAERWDDAVATFRRSVEIDPDYRHGVYQLGRTGALSGRNLEEAEAALTRFLADLVEGGGEAYHSGAWWRLGMIHQHRGEIEAARRAYAQSLEIDPDQRGAREALAKLPTESVRTGRRSRP